MGPADLSRLLAPLSDLQEADARLLVGIGTADDAGVYLLDDATALVQTIDVITPIVDDPLEFGCVAAVNALSDIYAMGGTPLTALTFLAFQACDLPPEAAALILEGAARTLRENGCALVGGHTVEDAEIKFGLAVTGTVRPDGVVTNSGAQGGDLIYLTKPLGTGIASTALKGRVITPELEEEFVRWMKLSNRRAAAAMTRVGVSAATDVTGFGLLGHLWEMCRGSGLGAVLDIGSIPLMTGVRQMVDMGMVPAGAYRNLEHLKEHLDATGLPERAVLPLVDPQTSGGLLMAVPPDRADSLELSLKEGGGSAYRIGLFQGERIIRLVAD